MRFFIAVLALGFAGCGDKTPENYGSSSAVSPSEKTFVRGMVDKMMRENQKETVDVAAMNAELDRSVEELRKHPKYASTKAVARARLAALKTADFDRFAAAEEATLDPDATEADRARVKGMMREARRRTKNMRTAEFDDFVGAARLDENHTSRATLARLSEMLKDRGMTQAEIDDLDELMQPPAY